MTGRRTKVVVKAAPHYYRGEDAYFTIEHYVDGVLTDASSVPKVSVEDHVGTAVVSAQDSTKDSTGKYHYEYAISSGATLGNYKVQVSAEYDSVTNLEGIAYFEVRKAVG